MSTAICGTLDELKWQYPQLEVELEREVAFITAQELEDLYPELTPRERENRFVSEHHNRLYPQHRRRPAQRQAS